MMDEIKVEEEEKEQKEEEENTNRAADVRRRVGVKFLNRNEWNVFVL